MVGLPKSGRLTKLVWCGRSRARRPRFKLRPGCLLSTTMGPRNRSGVPPGQNARPRGRVQRAAFTARAFEHDKVGAPPRWRRAEPPCGGGNCGANHAASAAPPAPPRRGQARPGRLVP